MTSKLVDEVIVIFAPESLTPELLHIASICPINAINFLQ